MHRNEPNEHLLKRRLTQIFAKNKKVLKHGAAF